ncbi:MAG: FAD-dependent oxidoreductase [Rhabdochlamydiaceae bacterium]
MKKVAVFGAGFTGLAICWHLLKAGYKVDLFDQVGIGGGASGIATGLMHPYVGEQSRLTFRGHEGLKASKKLLKISEDALDKPVADYRGIIRVAHDEEAYQNLLSYSDTKKLEEDKFLITSGATVFAQKYLLGLWQACQSLGARFSIQTFQGDLKDVDYDKVILCIGAGIQSYLNIYDLPLNFIKGQVLTCSGVLLDHSLVGKGYVTLSDKEGVFYLGATYERGKDFLDRKLVEEQLMNKYKKLIPNSPDPDLLDCRQGTRVNPKGHYFPLVKKLSSNTWIITGLGSRGLIYHALIAESLLLNPEFM